MDSPFYPLSQQTSPSRNGSSRNRSARADAPQTRSVPLGKAFLTYLAVTENVAASTQNQAFSSLLFLYQHVLEIDLGERINALRAKTSRYLPTVLTP
jgi:hypothetical protein